MGIGKGDVANSLSIKHNKTEPFEARTKVENYTDLFLFDTDEDYLYKGFGVDCAGEDDPSKLGRWYLIDKDNPQLATSWIRGNEPVPFNQVIQNGTFVLDPVTYIATLDGWGFNEDGVNYYPPLKDDLQLSPPDENYSRADIVIWNSVSGYQVVEGIPAEDYQIPTTPVGYFLVQTVIRNVDGTVEPVEPPDLSGYITIEDLELENLQKVASRGSTFFNPNVTGGSIGIGVGKSATLGNSTFFGWNPSEGGYGFLSTFTVGSPLVLQRRQDSDMLMPVMIGYPIGGITPDGTSMLMVRGDVNITGAYKVNGVPLGGASDFGDLGGDPYDNTALAEDLNRIEGKADVAQEDIDDLELVVAGKLTGTIAPDSDLQTQTTPTEDNKITSRRGLIYYVNWLKTQVVNVTGRWQFAGIGAGIASNVAAFLNVAVNTASLGQLLLPPSTLDYAGTLAGMIWNNSGEIKIITNGIVNRFLKVYDNELFKSDGNYVATFNQYGDLSANIKVTERWVYDEEIIDAIEGATYTDDRATISVSGKTLYKGQRHDDGVFSYEAISDNSIKRW